MMVDFLLGTVGIQSGFDVETETDSIFAMIYPPGK